MSLRHGRIAFGGAFVLAACLVGASSAEDAGINALPNRVYVHKDSKTAIRVPLAWEIIAPYRLRKSTASSVLGLEKADPRITVTIIWSPLGTRPWNDVIRAAEDDNLGEEHALLVTVYGKGKVGRPTTMKVGPFTVFKITLDAGPEEGKSAGAVYLFEAGSGEDRWKVKIRAVYPQVNREVYVKQVEDLLAQFTREE